MTPAKARARELASGPPAQTLERLACDGGSSGPAPSGLTKAAILMVSLGRDLRSQLLRQLSDEQVELVSREVARLAPVSAMQAASTLEEFHQTCVARDYVLEGGVDCARNMLTEAFGSDTALSIVDRLTNSLGADAADLVALQKSDPRQLAKLIYNEHPQIIALVLSHLVPVYAAALLNELPSDSRAEVTRRMAQLDQFSPEIIEKIASFISQRLKALGEVNRQSYGGVRAVAEMFNRLDTQASEELLSTISGENRTLSDSIRRLMFVFEDIRKLDKQDIVMVLPRIDRKSLPLALKSTSEELRDHFAQCMSARSAEMLREDIESLGPTRIRDIEAAQSAIIAVVRQLQTEGMIGNPNDGEKCND